MKRRRQDDVDKIYQQRLMLKARKSVGCWKLSALQLKQSRIFHHQMTTVFIIIYPILEHKKISHFLNYRFAHFAETNAKDDDLSDAESVHDYDHDSSGSSGAVQNDRLPIEILEPIKSLGLVEKLWQRAQPIAENVTQLLKETNKNMLKK